MRHLGPLIVGLLLLGVLGWEACQGSRSLAEWQQDTTLTFQGVQAREDSAEAMLALGMRLVEQGEQAKAEGQRLAQRGQVAYRSAMNYRREVDSLLAASPDTSPALQVALHALDSLEMGYDTLKAGFDSLEVSYGLLEQAFQAQLVRSGLLQANVDSLSALVRRAPEECRFLGLPCPRAYVGVGLTESGGTIRVGPTVGFGIRVPF